MAIKIRKKIEEEKVIQADNPEVLPPEGQQEQQAQAEDVAAEVKIPGLDDKFLATSGSVLQWLMEHRRMVILASCLVIVAALAVIGVKYAREASITSKSEVLTQAFVTYDALTTAEAQQYEEMRRQYLAQQGIAANTTEVLKSTYTVPNDKMRFVAIEKYLAEKLPEYAGNEIGTTGKLMLAGDQARLDHAANAKTSYDAASLSQQDDIKVYAKLGQVELLLNDAKFADAIAILDEIMAKHPGMSAFATLEKGRIHEMAGETDKAIAAYALVSRELGKDSDKTLAMSRLKYLTKDWETYITPAVPAQNNVPQAAL